MRNKMTLTMDVEYDELERDCMAVTGKLDMLANTIARIGCSGLDPCRHAKVTRIHAEQSTKAVYDWSAEGATP